MAKFHVRDYLTQQAPRGGTNLSRAEAVSKVRQDPHGRLRIYDGARPPKADTDEG